MAYVEWRRQQPVMNTTVTDINPIIASDLSGNIYVSYSTNEGTVSGGTNTGSEDIVVFKMNASGNVLWIKQQEIMNTTSADMNPSITTDLSGNVYITYRSGETVSGGTNIGGYDIVVLKMDTFGNVLWIKQQSLMNTTEDDYNQKIATDTSGNVYVTYYTLGTVSGGTNRGHDDIVVFKMDTGGNVLWVKQQTVINTTLNDSFPSITTDLSGNVYISYITYGEVSGGSFLGSTDVVVFKMNTSGNVLWIKQQPLMNTTTNDVYPSIVTDSSGNVYVTYRTDGTISGATITSGYKIVIFKMNTNGNVLWIKQQEIVNTNAGDDVYPAITTDIDGNIYVTYYKNDVISGGTNTGLTNVVFLKLDTSGNILWMSEQEIVNPNNIVFVSNITVDLDKNIYISYSTDQTESGGTNIGDKDVVVMKLFQIDQKSVPDAPTSVSAVPSNARAIVSFTPPTNNGGLEITNYTVTSSPDGITATGSSSPIIVSGLTIGTEYTFTVTATNFVGTSSVSSPSAPVTIINYWFSVASSADGVKLVATTAGDGGYLYTSTDSGVNWTARATNVGFQNWQDVASSANGTKLVAVIYNGQIYTSIDSGETWTARSTTNSWVRVASSSDGTKLVAVAENGQIYTSTNSGVDWTARYLSKLWTDVASSADGTKLVAVAAIDPILLTGQGAYTSTDSGLNWTQVNSTYDFYSIACSADGTKFVGGLQDGSVIISADSGVNWTVGFTGYNAPLTVASSADGTILVAAGARGLGKPLHASMNGGDTWVVYGAEYVKNWQGLALSSDGMKLLAAAENLHTGGWYNTIMFDTPITTSENNTISGNFSTINTYELFVNSMISTNSITSDSAFISSIYANTVNVSSIKTGGMSTNAISTNTIFGSVGSFSGLSTNAISTNTIFGSVGSFSGLSTNAISTNTIFGSVGSFSGLSTNAISTNTIFGSVGSFSGLSTNAISTNTIVGNVGTFSGLSTNAISTNTIVGSVGTFSGMSTNAISTNTIVGSLGIFGGLSTNAISTNTIVGSLGIFGGLSTNAISTNTIVGSVGSFGGLSTNTISTNTIIGNVTFTQDITCQRASYPAIIFQTGNDNTQGRGSIYWDHVANELSFDSSVRPGYNNAPIRLQGSAVYVKSWIKLHDSTLDLNQIGKVGDDIRFVGWDDSSTTRLYDFGFYVANNSSQSWLSKVRINPYSGNVRVEGSLTVVGAISKGSGSFRIDHPLPEKTNTHQLVHSFVESPKADLIYRGKVALVDGRALVNIDTAAGMTEGTFEALCRDVQCFTTNESDWIHVRGKVEGNILTIEAKDPTATSLISWMVIGERKDKHMYDTDWTDDEGRVIVEPLKNQEPNTMTNQSN
jgi:hypothetical protein